MNSDKFEDYLIKLMQDVASIKTALEGFNVEELRSKIDHLEAQNSDHEKSIRALEHRNDEMEKFVRGNMVDSKKQQTSTTLSVGLAVVSALLSIFLHIF